MTEIIKKPALEIKRVVGGAFYLPGDNMDTDRIIPARFLKCVTFAGLGDHVFEDDRAKLAGEHPFDKPENKGRNILIADENFGSGSSREHAVPALTQWGIQGIIAISFAAIFRGNATGNGLVCVNVSHEVRNKIVEEIRTGAHAVLIDLEGMSVYCEHPGISRSMPCTEICISGTRISDALPYTMPDSHRGKLVAGKWDDIVTCLEAGDEIEKTALRLPYFAALPA